MAIGRFDLTKHATSDLPPGEPAKIFDYEGQKLFNNQAKLKDEKALKEAGDYLQANKFGWPSWLFPPG